MRLVIEVNCIVYLSNFGPFFKKSFLMPLSGAWVTFRPLTNSLEENIENIPWALAVRLVLCLSRVRSGGLGTSQLAAPSRARAGLRLRLKLREQKLKSEQETGEESKLER